MNITESLTSYNFARNSNFVFSETVTLKQFKDLRIPTKYIVEKNDYSITYRLDFVELNNNDIIFCNSNFIDDLFYLLKKLNNVKNLKLITHQTDLLITKSIFMKKPNSISEWYSINVGYKDDNLIPIPIGIANEYSSKNVQTKDLKLIEFNNKENILYVNFNENTNIKARKDLYNLFSNKDWALVKNFNLAIGEYNMDIGKFKFILSPWGNGIDTHRFWEALYSGSIPVTTYHPTYEASSGLPVLFVENYKQITRKYLEDYISNMSNYKIDRRKLNISYWFELINQKKINRGSFEKISFPKYINFYLIFKFTTLKSIKSKYKVFSYFVLYPLRVIKKFYK